MDTPLYKRVLLKLSGEALMGDQTFGVEHKACEHIAKAIKEVYLLGCDANYVEKVEDITVKGHKYFSNLSINNPLNDNSLD